MNSVKKCSAESECKQTPPAPSDGAGWYYFGKSPPIDPSIALRNVDASFQSALPGGTNTMYREGPPDAARPGGQHPTGNEYRDASRMHTDDPSGKEWSDACGRTNNETRCQMFGRCQEPVPQSVWRNSQQQPPSASLLSTPRR